MKRLIRILNTVVAICCIFIIILIFWFLYLIYAKGFDGTGAAMYIVSEVRGWLDGLLYGYTFWFS